MAQRRTQAKGGSSPTDGEKEDDLNVLAPDREITVGGETVMVREYSFGEQLRHGALLAELTEALRPVKSTDADFVNRLLNILVEHQAQMLDAIALSIGRDRAWIEALSGVEGEALALTWWQVNQGFFVRRLMVYPTLAASALSRAPATAGGASSPPSSDTATPGAS